MKLNHKNSISAYIFQNIIFLQKKYICNFYLVSFNFTK